MRIVSLVPSITESLFDFGLTEIEVVGRTKFCIHPKTLITNVPVIGGTKNLNLDKIKALKPDLIIANKEENEKLQVEELGKYFKIWLTDIENLQDNQNFITDLGILLNKQELALNFNEKVNVIFESSKKNSPKKVAYLIWKNPYITVGSDTFIHEIIEKLGFTNLFKDRKRYPEISVNEMKEAEYVFLSSEPFPFQQKHIDELKKELPDSKIILVDGEAFSWYGTHLSRCGNYFKTLREIIE
jgi:ABC-type Fe3+-hydroxamate transport system substrate-binding protein